MTPEERQALESERAAIRGELERRAMIAERDAIRAELARRGGEASPSAPPSLNLPGPPDLMRMVPDALNVFGNDFVTQSAGTTIGTTVGTAAGGPLGGIVGGAAGNVLGKLGARFLTPEDDNPSGSELALDAAIGAAGPATTTLAKAGAKAFVGMTDDVVKKGAEAAKKILGDEFHLGMSWRALSRVLDRADVGQRETVRKALIEGLHTQTRGGLSQRGGELGALGTFLLNGEPTHSLGILLGGYGLSALHRGSARALLNTDLFVNWLLQAPKTLPSKTDLIGSLGALAAEKAINSDVRTAINDLMDSIRRAPDPQPEENEPAPRRKPQGPTFRNPPARTGDPFSGRRRLHRDPRTGRFTDAQNPRAIDHSGLEDLFGRGSD